ncbi:7-carboxy-7-deazaguanine synthase QueE [Patescibacteria group bacterium]|nr:7-carboxy-7-deazaguanine synthase QueE [Patescibacteria group bacterium]
MKRLKKYVPTKKDFENLRFKKEQLKISGDGIFATLQGEGVTAGLPAVFLRLHNCNLSCGKPTGWKCDTWYTWDKDTAEYWQEPYDLGYKDAVSEISRAWKEKFNKDKKASKRLVITGGEPLLQQKKIVKLLNLLPGTNVEIETNGTIKPIKELSNCQFNCSPKLKNSGNKTTRRYKPEVIKFINTLPNSWFKFVVTNQTDLHEIDQIIDECSLTKQKIIIMPEGLTAKIVSKHAQTVTHEIKERGWKLSMRNQLVWYGQERRT